MAKVRMFGQITKVEDMGDGTRMISGIASTPTKDSDGESFTGDCLRGAIPDYMAKRRAVREMHQPIAAGVTTEMYVDDDDVTHITAHVVDPVTVLKVDTGVLKMFSIQGNVPPGGRDAVNRKIIHKLNLREVSLVDVGANPDCMVEVVKLDGDEGDDVEVTEEVVPEVVPEAAPAVEVPAEPVVKVETPNPLIDLVTKWAGEEVWDTARAVDALGQVFSILCGEISEAENEPAQVASLQKAVEGLKAFIASEIMEDNTTPDAVAMADTKPGDDPVEKKGAKFSAATKGKLAEAHDHIQKAADCMKASGYDDSAKAETAVEGEDTVAKVAGLTDEVSKLSTERDTLKDQVTKLEGEAKQHEAALDEIVKGMKAKGFLRVVEKGNDDSVSKSDAGVEAEPSDPLDAIRKIHKSGGVTIQPRA